MNPHDLGEGLVRKEEGMLRAEEHAPDGWITRAVSAIRTVCLAKDRFTADDIWATGLDLPSEGRAFGPAMMRAAKLGYCQKTGAHTQTGQPKSHAAPIAIWQSRLYRGEPSSPPPKGSLFMSNHHANVLVADLPWPFGDKLPGGGRGAEKHYKVMSVSDIMRFPLPPLEEIAMLVLWRVASQQQEALDVVKAWGFTVKSEIVWVKTKAGTTDETDDPEDEKSKKIGMGHYVRNEHETALVCTRGSFKVHDRGVRSTFRAPIGAHSEKPEKFFELVERLAGPDREGHLCELFGRRARIGWHVYGDELPQGYVWTPRTSGPRDAAANVGSHPSAPQATDLSVAHGALSVARGAPTGCAACDRGEMLQPGREHVHTGEGPQCQGHVVAKPASRVAPGEAIPDPRKFAREIAWDAAAARATRIDPHPEHDDSPPPPSTGNLPAHVVHDLGKHPALCSDVERALFVTRAVGCGLLSEEEGRHVADAWIKLQYRAGPGFFQVEASSIPKDVLPNENIGELADRLHAKGHSVNLIDLAGLSVTKRDVLRAWLDQGGDPPEFLAVYVQPSNETASANASANGTARRGRPKGSKNKSSAAANESGWTAAGVRVNQWIAADMPEEPSP
jgi:N6-adenosine-specific RNA methylase IME4